MLALAWGLGLNLTMGRFVKQSRGAVDNGAWCAVLMRAGRGLNCSSGAKNLMRTAVRQMDLTARAYHRVLKLSRTIADLAGEEAIQAQHLAEALQYRPRSVV